ncbi:MAG TPA: hypothetical protein DCO69_04780, partial [Clostridiales bacterium]|nr:hypothetical protein [Clostridiales bacterium]
MPSGRRRGKSGTGIGSAPGHTTWISNEGGGNLETILTAVIGGGVTLVGVLIANSKTQAVMDEKITELTREVR